MAIVRWGWIVFVVGRLLWLPATGMAQSDPTPIPEGAVPITIEVLPNDSLWELAARAGISLTELLALNGLTENDLIQPGQQLIIGYSTPEPTATPVVLPTERPTLPPPTPSRTAVPPPPTGICLTAFIDVNGNGIHEAAEPLKTAVAFTIFNENVVVANYVTDGVSEPFCLDNLAEGTYHITRSAETDEVLTTPGDRGIIVQSGDVVEMAFGSVKAADAPIEIDETAVSPPNAVVIGETAVPLPSLPAEGRAPSADSDSRWGIIVVVGVVTIILLAAGLYMLRSVWAQHASE